MTQITQILLSSGMVVSLRLKVTVSERHLFKKKFFGVEVLGISRPYLKEYFQEHQSSAFSFISKTKTLLFSGMLVLERAKITVWEGYLFKNSFTMELLGMCLPYVKRYFQEYQWSAFFSIAQIAEILLFIGVLGLENSRITVWVQ